MSAPRQQPIELICPAGSLPALKIAVDQGANGVYLGLRNATNARNFTGLNFDEKSLSEGVNYAHKRGCKVFLALNTYPTHDGWDMWCQAVDLAARVGVDAVIMADPGLMHYTKQHWPNLRIHLSVQGSASNYEAINFYQQQFGITRAVLPRVLSTEQIAHLIKNTTVEIEVFGFGSLCVMAEGRCAFSSYLTGKSPNTTGVCSPSTSVRWQQTAEGLECRLNQVLLDRYQEGENASYPTVCKGRYFVNGKPTHAIGEPASLSTLAILPTLKEMGVSAIKIEGRQRSTAYVSQVTKIWRSAIDRCEKYPEKYTVESAWVNDLNKVSEGLQHTLGAYDRKWK